MQSSPSTGTECASTLDWLYNGIISTQNWVSMLGVVCGEMGAGFCISCNRVDDDGALVNGFASDGIREQDLHAGTEILCRLAREYGHDGPIHCSGEAEAGFGWYILLRDGTDHLFLFVFPEHRFSDAATRWLETYSDHLVRCARLRGTVESTSRVASEAVAMLDLLRLPVFLVDSRLRVVLSNTAAGTMINEGIVRLAGTELRFASRPALDRARAVITSISLGKQEGSADLLIRLDDNRGGDPLLAMIEPLEGLFPNRTSAPDAAVAAIILKDPRRRVLSAEAALRELHGMPPAEARFATAIADGLTIREYAEREELSESYVRDLSKRVMARLGVNRQPDLVRAILQLAPDM